MSDLTHLDAAGKATMVDISDKPITERQATAQAIVSMQQETFALIKAGKHKKGDVITIARIAGIQAAKKCADLIPLCHPLLLSSIRVDIELDETKHQLVIEATCKLAGSTGVEMEALTAASVAALTIYDMCKAVDKDMQMTTRLLAKSGGRSGNYVADIA